MLWNSPGACLKRRTLIQSDPFEPKAKDVFSSATYHEFRDRLIKSSCQRCDALALGRTNIVVDRGNPGAKIALIGEAPGESEDLQGKAFVGRAGQLLDKMMASIGLNTNEDTIVLNIVKCRPPENRAPKHEEAENCFPYLKKQLDFIAPRAIVLLGRTAAKYFVMDGQKVAMKDQVGRMFDIPSYPGIGFMVLYHPAFLLRDPRKKPETWTHLKNLKIFLEETQHETA